MTAGDRATQATKSGESAGKGTASDAEEQPRREAERSAEDQPDDTSDPRRETAETKTTYADLLEREAELRRQLAGATLLQRISADLVHEEDLQVLYGKILDAAVEIMHADFGSMQMLEPRSGGGSRLRLLTHRGFTPEAAEARDVVDTGSASACGAALRTGERVIVPDVLTHREMDGTDALKVYEQLGIRAVQSTPLVSRSGSLLGMISTHWREPHDPGEPELRLLDLLARQAADLIERHHAEQDRLQRLARFQSIVDQSMVGIAQSDVEGRFVFVNDRFCEITGMTREELIGNVRMPDITHPDDLQRNLLPLRKMLETGDPFPIEKRYVRPDGSYVWVFNNITAISDSSGNIVGTTIVCVDIADRKRAEEALRESEHRFRALFTAVREGFVLKEAVTDAEGRIVDFRFLEANRAFEVQTGLSDVVGKTMREVMPDIEPRWIEAYAKIVQTGEPLRFQDRAASLNRWFQVFASRVDDAPDGRVAILVSDITERKRAEEQLQRNHETFFNLIQNSPFGVYIVDSEFCLRQVSAGAQKVFQNVRPLIGRDFAEVLRSIWEEPFASEAISHFRRTLETGEPFEASDTTERRRDISDVESYDWRIERITLPDGQFGVVCYFYDLSDIRRVEAELRNRSQQLETLINQAPLGVYLVDADFRIAHVNPVARPVFGGVSDPIGRDLEETLHAMWPPNHADEIARAFRRTLKSGESFHRPEFAEQRVDRGETEYYDWSIDRIMLPDGRYGVVCYFRDISEQVRARNAIAESEARYRTLFESIDEGFCIVRLIFNHKGEPIDWRYLEVNPAFEQHTGMKDAAGKTIRELVPDIEPVWFDVFGKVHRTGEPVRFVDHAESLGRWYDVYAFRIDEPHEHKVAFLFNDITRQKRALQQLEELTRTLEQRVEERTRTVRELAARLTIAEQEERRRVSQILHDDLQQILVGIQMKMSMTALEVKAGKAEEAVDGLREAEGWLRQAINMTRQLTVDLSPPILKGEGLTDTANWLRKQMKDLHGLEVRIEAERAFIIPDEGLRVLLFQILRELLFNVAKHAETDCAVAELSEEPAGHLRMRVIDRGRGLDAEAHEAGAAGVGGFGLFNIRERVNLLGGRMDIESAPGQGTTVTVCVPLATTGSSGDV